MTTTPKKINNIADNNSDNNANTNYNRNDNATANNNNDNNTNIKSATIRTSRDVEWSPVCSISFIF